MTLERKRLATVPTAATWKTVFREEIHPGNLYQPLSHTFAPPAGLFPMLSDRRRQGSRCSFARGSRLDQDPYFAGLASKWLYPSYDHDYESLISLTLL